MERYSMYLVGKNQYCENDYTTKCNLQIQCNPYQITNDFFHRTKTKNFTIHVENKRPQIVKAVLRKKNGTGGINQTMLQNYSHQDSMLLALKQKYRPMEQDREPGDKATHIWVPCF